MIGLGAKKAELDALADLLIATLRVRIEGAVEGEVRFTSGAGAGYRRVDCDHRALAYVRSRPRKNCVRVDVSGLWLMPHSTLAVRSAQGSTLLLQHADDVSAVAKYLEDGVALTRRSQAKSEEIANLQKLETAARRALRASNK